MLVNYIKLHVLLIESQLTHEQTPSYCSIIIRSDIPPVIFPNNSSSSIDRLYGISARVKSASGYSILSRKEPLE